MIIKKDKDTTQNYFEDSSGLKGSFADFVAIVENEDDIKKFLVESSQKKMPVTIVGALTGNTASALAFGGAVLSLERLNKIGDIKVIDDKTATIKVQAGARISDIKQKVSQANWMYPPDPTEKTALIGGNISTNASGGRGFKFGVTRDYIKSLKVIFSDGQESFIERGKYFADDEGKISFDTDKGKKHITLPKYKLPRIKNAAGYFNYPNADLIDVFIGSEGTLAVIVEAELLLIPNFKSVFGGIIFFKEVQKAYNIVKSIKEEKEVKPMSLEYLDKRALGLIQEDYPLIPKDTQAAIMFEQDVYKDNDFDKLMDDWVALIEKNGIDTNDVWFASDEEKLEEFRVFRHRIPEKVNEMVKKNGIPKIGTDFAVPEGKLIEIINFSQKEFDASGLFNLTFGHIGENHLHANIIATNEKEYKQTREIYVRIAKKVVDLGGTVSAEHGIGKQRHIFLEIMVGQTGIKEMQTFKASIDPSMTLGQNNIFPKAM